MARIIALLLIVASCFSATYWIHSSLGNDAWPGTSPDSAFASLGAATALMTQCDFAFACGSFNESLTLSNNKHEGCTFAAWPDSADWLIDGDSLRTCAIVGDYCGQPNELAVSFYNLIAVYPANYSIMLGESSSGFFKNCSITSYSAGIYTNHSQLVMDSCSVYAETYCIFLNGNLATITNSSLTSVSDYCIKETNNPSTLISTGNIFQGYGGIYCYNGLAARHYSDIFRVSTRAIYAYRNSPQYFELVKCLFVGGEFGLSSTYYNATQPFFSIVNCCFDSIDNALSFVGLRGAVNIINTIFINCNKAIDSPDLINAAGLVIHSCGTDTTGLKQTISYHSFDPELDFMKIARSDSCKYIGVSSAFGLDAPVYDDLGHTFFDSAGQTAIGWRSPYSVYLWSCPDIPSNQNKWGINSPGKRIK